jgi:hypothetical protein
MDMDWDAMTPLDSFHLFACLPPELRLRIWDFNLPAGRLVPIQCGSDIPPSPSPSWRSSPQSHGNKENVFQTDKDDRSWGCTSRSPIPSNLHACAESRAHALSRYSLTFSFAHRPPQVFFRPENDILYFGPRPGYMAANAQLHTFLCLTNPVHLASVRRIAIDNALFWADSGFGLSTARSMAGAGPQHYWSMLAVSLTIDALRQIRRRMPLLEEIIFVPQADGCVEDKEIMDTLSHQVQTAIRDLVAQGASEWEGGRCPRWSILGCPLTPSMTPSACEPDLTSASLDTVPHAVTTPDTAMISPHHQQQHYQPQELWV